MSAAPSPATPIPIAPRLAPTDTSTVEHARLNAAVTGALNAHDLAGAMDRGAPEDEYDPETGDFVRLIEEGVTITPEVVAAVWHEWFGDSDGETAGEVEPATPAMKALVADLQAAQREAGKP